MSEVMTIDPAPVEHDELIRVLQSSLYPGARPESIELVLAYCRANHLDVMLKPVHIVPTSVKKPDGQWETRDVLMPGIADYRIKAARSGQYGGKSEPEFGPDVTATLGGVTVTYPAWCRVTVRRIVQGEARDFPAKERWLENYATAKRDSDAPNRMWLKRPYGQLAKCCEAQALRMAFPEFSAGYTAEEMEGRTIENFNGPTLEHSEAASPERQAINDAVPLKAAAAPIRIERKVDPTVYEPPKAKPLPRTPAEWNDWMDNDFIPECTSFDPTTDTRADLEAMTKTERFKAHYAAAPPPVRRDIDRQLAATHGVLPEKLADPPAEEELGEVEIEGESKVAAG